MGLAGLSIIYQRFEYVFAVPLGVGLFLLVISHLVFAGVSVTYALKLLRHTSEVSAEFSHPVKSSFFPTISISLMLLAIATQAVSQEISRYLWMAGAVLQITFTIIIMSRWFSCACELSHANPAWFIPMVGNIVVPIAGGEFIHRELAWFFFSIGLFLWLVLFTVIFYRLVLYKPLPARLMPTMFIMVAPPALGFLAYMQITGQMDNFARVLLYIAIFFIMLLFSMARTFTALDFSVSWWAFTFPMCAVTLAVLMAYKFTGFAAFSWLAVLLLSITTLVVAKVALATINGLRKNTICIPE